MALKSKPQAAAKAPKHLSAKAREFWSLVASDYSITGDPAGEGILTVACESLDRYWQAQQEINDKGLLMEDRYGCCKLNPACAVEKANKQSFLAAMRALRLDIEPPHSTAGRPPGK
jgi:P27 family predicted phage terminase small subunit